MREVEEDSDRQGISRGANFFKFHQKNAPKSMKNVQFWSGFLHMILKLIPKDRPTFVFCLLTLCEAVSN